MTSLTKEQALKQVKHNFNIGDIVTVSKIRDSYENADIEQEVSILKDKKLIISEIVTLDQYSTVYYHCIDENRHSPKFGDNKLAFREEDLIVYADCLVLNETIAAPVQCFKLMPYGSSKDGLCK